MRKTALITGASSGIGKSLARIHAENGGNLVIVARREDKLIELKKELESTYGVEVIVFVKDLSAVDAAISLYQEVQSLGIRIDYLINNAGFGLRGKFDELPWDKQYQMMQLNMIALTQLTHLFLPELLKRPSAKILNTSSTASFMPGPLQAVYFATKAFVTFFSNALSEELRGTSVTVTNLMPGATESEFASTSGMDKTQLFNKTATSQSVARDGYNAMLKGDIDVVSGLTFSQKIMMSMIPFTPKKMLLKQVRKMQEVK